MIPVNRVIEPPTFHDQVREPGKAWLKAHPQALRPAPYWDAVLQPLETGFGGLCGYAAMLDPTGGTVDHYLSYRSRPDLAYEWDNYRFASATLNSSKKNADDSVLDPYEVREGWFEVLLPSLQLQTTDRVPKRLRKKAEYTLKRLRLRDGERVIRWRMRWYEMYQSGKLTLSGLREVAPLIAEAVARQNADVSARKRK